MTVIEWVILAFLIVLFSVLVAGVFVSMLYDENIFMTFLPDYKQQERQVYTTKSMYGIEKHYTPHVLRADTWQSLELAIKSIETHAQILKMQGYIEIDIYIDRTKRTLMYTGKENKPQFVNILIRPELKTFNV